MIKRALILAALLSPLTAAADPTNIQPAERTSQSDPTTRSAQQPVTPEKRRDKPRVHDWSGGPIGPSAGDRPRDRRK